MHLNPKGGKKMSRRKILWTRVLNQTRPMTLVKIPGKEDVLMRTGVADVSAVLPRKAVGQKSKKVCCVEMSPRKVQVLHSIAKRWEK